MEWLINLINYGLKGKEIESSNNNLKTEIVTLTQEINSLIKTIDEMAEIQKNLRTSAEKSEKKYKDTLKELTSYKSSQEPTKISDYLEKTTQRYRWKPSQYRYLRYSLDNISKDQDYIGLFTGFLIGKGLKENYPNADAVIFKAVKIIYNYLDDLPDDYNTDKESFGEKEYWLTPQESFDYYITGKEAGDCDDTSALIYGSIISALIYTGYESEIWRIKRIDIKKPIAHALVAWLNQRGEWKRIESTYWRDDFTKKWNDHSDIFKSVYTIIWHIFDEESEYKLK